MVLACDGLALAWCDKLRSSTEAAQAAVGTPGGPPRGSLTRVTAHHPPQMTHYAQMSLPASMVVESLAARTHNTPGVDTRMITYARNNLVLWTGHFVRGTT
jgi:hypothetical protein